MPGASQNLSELSWELVEVRWRPPAENFRVVSSEVDYRGIRMVLFFTGGLGAVL